MASSAGEDDVSGGGEHDVSAGHNERMAWQATHWREFRRPYPIRASGGIVRTDQPRPERNLQRAWHEYSNFQPTTDGSNTFQQQWLLTLFSGPTGRTARRYTNPVPVCDPFQYIQSLTGAVLEQYTSIGRIEALAAEHPLVEHVSQHKV